MVTDLTELGQGLPPRALSMITHIIVHRIEDGEDARAVAQFFKSNPQWTGGGMGYAIVIKRDGTIEQACALNRRAPGARAANGCGIQVACVGDFRKHEPTVSQWGALCDVCEDLATFIGPNAKIMGHTEFPGASADPNKVCPGPLLDMNALRDLVEDTKVYWPKTLARTRCEALGYVFERK